MANSYMLQNSMVMYHAILEVMLFYIHLHFEHMLTRWVGHRFHLAVFFVSLAVITLLILSAWPLFLELS